MFNHRSISSKSFVFLCKVITRPDKIIPDPIEIATHCYKIPYAHSHVLGENSVLKVVLSLLHLMHALNMHQGSEISVYWRY